MKTTSNFLEINTSKTEAILILDNHQRIEQIIDNRTGNVLYDYNGTNNQSKKIRCAKINEEVMLKDLIKALKKVRKLTV